MASTKETPTGYLYNDCYGGLGLSDECVKLYKKDTGKDIDSNWFERSDPVLIKYFLEKGSEWMSTDYSKIAFYEVPKELLPYIGYHEYDGLEDVGVSSEIARRTFMDKFYESVIEDMSNLQDEFVKLKNNIQTVDKLGSKFNEKK